ncbi:hypothetical protein [uncultured Celeribacter sp.]|uniref:hypothetical protein n=1 Tax=uncultured Celeribacter sp. TaxID=1303376 RepID=UPI0037486FD2
MDEIDNPKQYLADIIGFGTEVDIMPLVHQAMARCPYVHDFTPREIADLVVIAARGIYIPVDTLERIEGRNLGALTGFVILRIQSEYRIQQLTNPSIQKSMPYLELEYFKETGICDGAAKLLDRWLAPDELTALPLNECTHKGCTCRYRSNSKRQAQRRHPLRAT